MDKDVDSEARIDLSSSSLISTWHSVDARNRQVGWMRFDPWDIDEAYLARECAWARRVAQKRDAYGGPNCANFHSSPASSTADRRLNGV